MIIYNHPNKSLAVHESLTTGRCFAHSFPSFSSASTPRCQSCETKIDIKHGVLWTKSGEPSFCRRFCWIPYGRNDVNLYVENRDTVYWTVWSTLFFVQNKAMFQVWHDSQMVLLVQPKPEDAGTYEPSTTCQHRYSYYLDWNWKLKSLPLLVLAIKIGPHPQSLRKIHLCVYLCSCSLCEGSQKKTFISFREYQKYWPAWIHFLRSNQRGLFNQFRFQKNSPVPQPHKKQVWRCRFCPSSKYSVAATSASPNQLHQNQHASACGATRAEQTNLQSKCSWKDLVQCHNSCISMMSAWYQDANVVTLLLPQYFLRFCSTLSTFQQSHRIEAMYLPTWLSHLRCF